MFKIFKNVIENSDFDLRDILKKIEESYIKSDLSKEEKTSLEVQKQIDELAERISKLEKNSSDGEEGTTEEYPEYKQPSGSHDAYHVGDKITFNEKKYICKLDNCVWSPSEYPVAWEEVIE